MPREEFEDAVRDALDEIPDELAALMDDVVVLVEDDAPADDPELLGLYEGTPLTERTGWWAAGSLVMGTGIWSMHFVGMHAFRLPIDIGFSGGLTLASWLAAVAASAMALHLASRDSFRFSDLALGALFMGTGISGMHYIGMAAMAMTPGIVWSPLLVTVSVLIAVIASASALLIFQLLRRVNDTLALSWSFS